MAVDVIRSMLAAPSAALLALCRADGSVRPIAIAVPTLVLAACSSQAVPEPSAATFDLRAVEANLAAECESPNVVDELFCDQVVINEITGIGESLVVRTSLSPSDTQRARAICQQLAQIHVDGEGNSLGYNVIGIRDRDGGRVAACSV